MNFSVIFHDHIQTSLSRIFSESIVPKVTIEIGAFEGAYFVETPRMYSATDGSGSAKNYRTIIAGQQALAEAVAEEPHTVIGPVVDRLMRHRPMGWYGVLGFSRYREEALYRIESGSSIGAL